MIYPCKGFITALFKYHQFLLQTKKIVECPASLFFLSILANTP